MVTTTYETMSSFNYWIDKGYSPDVALKLSKSKNQAGLIAKDEAYRQQQQANKPPQMPKAPDPIIPAPPPTKIGDSGGSRLKINKKAKRNRGQLRGGTTQQRIALNTPPSNAGGVNIGGG